MKQPSEDNKQKKRKKNTPQLVFRFSLAVVCCVLYGTNSRGTPNTRTSPTDITLSNSL